MKSTLEILAATAILMEIGSWHRFGERAVAVFAEVNIA
jgi:hypothetical protein